MRTPSCVGDAQDVEVRVMRLTPKDDRGLVRTENCMVNQRGQTRAGLHAAAHAAPPAGRHGGE